MIDMIPGLKPPVKELFGLANSSFQPAAFRLACETFSRFDVTSSDDDLWYFSIPGGPSLLVGLEAVPTGRKKPNGYPEYRQIAVRQAILSICWWETFLQSQHKSLASFRAERTEFDRLYEKSLKAASRVLGAPRLQGADQDDHGHRHAIWRGKTGLLILQQSAYDPQFGLDVNYWVQPWSGPDPCPTSPFIDWLCKLSLPG